MWKYKIKVWHLFSCFCDILAHYTLIMLRLINWVNHTFMFFFFDVSSCQLWSLYDRDLTEGELESSLHYSASIDDSTQVDLRWVRMLVLHTLELLHDGGKWESLAHFALLFNSYTRWIQHFFQQEAWKRQGGLQDNEVNVHLCLNFRLSFVTVKKQSQWNEIII